MRKVFCIALLLLTGVSTSSNAQILAEIFRDVGCSNCTDPDNAFDLFVNQHPEYKVIPVYMHNGFTVRNDIFYQACQADVDYRDSYSGNGLYNVTGDPYGMINGSLPFPDPTKEASWVDEVKGAPSLVAAVTITDSMLSNGKMQIHMHVESQAADLVVKPYILLVESNLFYDNPYGYGKVPNNLWNNIFRGMVPAKDGGAQFALSGKHDFTYLVDTTGKGWNLQNLKLVGIVQDAFPQSGSASYLIYGIGQTPAVKSSVNTIRQYSSSLNGVVPNPASSNTAISFGLSKSSFVNITVSDALGRNVATIANGVYPEGNNSVTFTPTNHQSGVYFVTMTVDGVFVASEKVIFE
jgi:hypothetical protein